MNGYDVDGQILDYILSEVTESTSELHPYFYTQVDIFTITHLTLPEYIEMIQKELATTRWTIHFVTSKAAHSTVETQLGDDKAFRFGIEFSLTTSQLVQFDGEPKSLEEEQTHLVIIESKWTRRNKPYNPFRGTCSIFEVKGSSNALVEPWNPPPTPPEEQVPSARVGTLSSPLTAKYLYKIHVHTKEL